MIVNCDILFVGRNMLSHYTIVFSKFVNYVTLPVPPCENLDTALHSMGVHRGFSSNDPIFVLYVLFYGFL